MHVLTVLAIKRRVMRSPEDVKELTIGDTQGVKVQLHSFCVVSNTVIRGATSGATAVADSRAKNSWNSSKARVRSPVISDDV